MSKAHRLLAVLTLLTLVLYWPVHGYGFVEYDDGDYIVGNFHLKAAFFGPGLKYCFTTFSLGSWSPLLWVSFFIDRWLFNLRPQGLHIENVLLHLTSGLLLWRFIYVCTRRLNAGFVVASLFLVHPMHVESVAWISERKDVLSTPFLIGAMIAYVRYCQRIDQKRWLAYAMMILLFACSLMVKTMGVTLPGVLLQLDYWPLQRWRTRRWIGLVVEKIPLMAISLATSMMAHAAQTFIGATTSTSQLSMIARIDNAIVCYVIYAGKLLVPVYLCVFYHHPGPRPLTPVFAAGLLLAMISIFVVWCRRERPYLIVGWLWFIGTLVPVIGLVQIGGQSMADRYSYLPSIGFFIAVVWGINNLLKSERIKIILSTVMIGTFSVLTLFQVSYWRDTQTLFTHATRVTDDNPVAHVVLAQLAFEKNDIHRAVDECNLALRSGDNARAYFGLGNCWLADDRSKAINYYRKAVATDPNPVIYHVNLASALSDEGTYDEAKAEIQTALRREPDYPLALDVLKRINAAAVKANH